MSELIELVLMTDPPLPMWGRAALHRRNMASMLTANGKASRSAINFLAVVGSSPHRLGATRRALLGLVGHVVVLVRSAGGPIPGRPSDKRCGVIFRVTVGSSGMR